MKFLLSLIAAIVLMISSFLSPAKAIVLFEDVYGDHPFAFEIAYLYNEGIISGYPDGTFKPDAPVIRSHAVAMIGRALDLDNTARATGFQDVPANHKYSGNIASAVEDGIIFGFPNNYFRPNMNVTRGQLAAMLDRAFYFPDAPDSNFLDMNDDHYAFNAVSRLNHQGVAHGYPGNTFRPDIPVTRAQFAAFLARAIEPSFIAEKQELLLTANEILESLQGKAFDDVAAYVSSSEGLTLCPSASGCNDTEGVTFTKSQLPGLMNDTNDYVWGYENGSGLEINLTPAEYYDEHLMDATYIAKEDYGRNMEQTAQEFIHQQYPEAIVVDYYSSGASAHSLNMVFEKNSEGNWVLIAIVNE